MEMCNPGSGRRGPIVVQVSTAVLEGGAAPRAPLEAFEFQTRRSIARSLERLKLSPACRADQYNAVWALFANLVCIFLFAPVHSAFDSCGLEYQLHS